MLLGPSISGCHLNTYSFLITRVLCALYHLVSPNVALPYCVRSLAVGTRDMLKSPGHRVKARMDSVDFSVQ